MDQIGRVAPGNELMAFLFLAMCAGPSLSSLLLTFLRDGKQGMKDLISRLSRWRVKGRWYTLAIFTPALIGLIYFLLSRINPVFRPAIFEADSKLFLIMAGVLGGLAAGFFEELGWTGFAIPRLREKYGRLATGLIVGFFWGLWHLPLFMPGDASGEIPSVLFLLVLLFTYLPAYRVLIVWILEKTDSLFVSIVTHTGLTAGIMIFPPAIVSGKVTVVFDLSLAVVLWILVFFVLRRQSVTSQTQTKQAVNIDSKVNVEVGDNNFGCETCKLRRKAESNPNSLTAIIWRWHTRWCPGWKAYQDSLVARQTS